MLKKHLPIFFLLAFTFFCGCDNIYKAGNRVTLDYTIDTKLSFQIVRLYLDSLAINGQYRVPPKWNHLTKLVDIDPENSKRVYFAHDPEEMYLIQFNGVLLLADVYNPQIVDGDYIAMPERMHEGGKEKVLKRFQTEILDQIERMAKRDGCPDSMLYCKPRYVNGDWTVEPTWSPRRETVIRN